MALPSSSGICPIEAIACDASEEIRITREAGGRSPTGEAPFRFELEETSSPAVSSKVAAVPAACAGCCAGCCAGLRWSTSRLAPELFFLTLNLGFPVLVNVQFLFVAHCHLSRVALMFLFENEVPVMP